MLVLGLTGSIATGKSTASRLLAFPPYSLPLIDADVLAREVVAKGTVGFHTLVRTFGPTTPDLLLPSGDLDRLALGRRVFGDPVALKQLNRIVHPLVRKAMFWGILKAWANGAWAVVVDVPLLFEAGMDRFCGGAVLVVCGKEKQMQRLLKRNPDLTEEEARRRVESQMDLEEKVRRVGELGDRGWVVDNNGSLEDLEREVKRVMEQVQKRRAGKWRYVWNLPPVAVVYALVVLVSNWRISRASAAKAKL